MASMPLSYNEVSDSPTGGLVVRGTAEQQLPILVTSTPDDFVEQSHPIRRIKPIVEHVLVQLEPTFAAMYSKRGRPSVPPEYLLKATVLMALFSVRGERQFCEQLRYNLLFKWFLNMNIDDRPFDHSSFSKNRDRLLQHDVARAFFSAVYEQAQLQRYTSDEHFSVDGTLVQAWASMKSIRPIDEDKDGPGDTNGWLDQGQGGRNPDVNFRGQRRKNDTHRSTTDPEAMLARKGRGQPAILGYAAHALMENRNGLIADVELTRATGRAELDTAERLVKRQQEKRNGRRATVGGDKGYDNRDFVRHCREMGVTPHVARNTETPGGSAIDGRTTRHDGYKLSQRKRKRIEEIFGWAKTVGATRKLRFIGQACNGVWVTMMAASYNLVRMSKLQLTAD
jgi:transposase